MPKLLPHAHISALQTKPASAAAIRLLLLALMTLATLPLLACGSSVEARITPGDLKQIPKPKGGPVFLFNAPKVPSDWSGDETYKRTRSLIQAMDAEGWLVIAPWELELTAQLNDADLLKDPSVTALVEREGGQVQQLWVANLTFSESSSVQSTNAELGGGARTARQYQRYLEAQLSLRDPRLRRSICGVSVRIAQDPLDDEASYVDPLPALTQAMPVLAQSVSDLLAQEQIEPQTRYSSDIEFQANPKLVESYALARQVSLEEAMATMDDFERSARLIGHYQFFLPEIDADQMNAFRKGPVGLTIDDPAELEDKGLKQGDIILQVEGSRAFDGFVLERALSLPTQRSTLTLLRDNQKLEIQL